MMRALVTLVFLAQAAPQENYEKELKALSQEYWRDRDREFFEKDPNLVYVEKLRDVAKRAVGTKWGAEALGRAFGLAVQINDERLGVALAEELISKYPDSESHLHIAASCYGGSTRSPAHWPKDVLRMIANKSSCRDAKAGSRYWLACLLVDDQKTTADEKAEGRKLFEEVKKEYRGAKPHFWDHGDQPDFASLAEGSLFELDHLQVGMTAPDFEATGLDGNTFKLSDFRGKMVVVEFWRSDRDWGRHFPDRQALLERMKGKPFVLLGVNGDNPAGWRKVHKQGLTWPNSVDGGKWTLCNRWNIRHWPTQYLLDAKGVIRMKSEPWWNSQGTVEYDKDGNYKSIGWLIFEAEKLFAQLAKE